MRPCLNALRCSARRTSAAMLVLSWVAVSYVVSAQTTPLTLVSTAWAPFTNAPGQPRFALDLVEAALGRIGAHGEDDDRQRRAIHALAPHRQVRRQRRRMEGSGAGARADLLAAVSREPARARRPARRRRVGEDAGRSQGQAGGDRRRLLVRR